LLAGDIETEGQARLIEKGVRLRHSVLKVPHHGSKYILPEFINRVAPDLSVVSVGRNSLGLPDPGTVASLNNGGGEVYRTDLDGLLVLRCDGKRITVTAYE
jgi:competence protein ComEC